MPLALWERIAVGTLKKPRYRFVQSMFIITRLERARDRPAFSVADELRDLVAEGALAELRKALPQICDAAAGAGVLGTEGIEIAEQVLVDQG